MGRSIRIGLLVALTMMAGTAGRAFAVGLGGYVAAGGGDVEGEYEFDRLFGTQDVDGDAGRAGAGFVFELHPAGESIFNYRVGVGLEKLDIELDFEDESFGPEFDLAGVVVEHNFGFAVMRHEVARLWLGPQVRMGLYGGDGDIDFPAVYNFLAGVPDVRGDAFVAEFGIGGVFGANFHVGDAFTISTTTGLRVSSYRGINEDDNNDDELRVKGGTAFFTLAFMARTGGDRK